MTRSLLTTVAIFLLLTLISLAFIPQTQAYTFDAHSICKGWTDDVEKGWVPIGAERFLAHDSVYLYFHISWESCKTEANKVDWRVALMDPERSEANVALTTFYRVKFEGGCLTSAFLPILNVTETTKNGMWGVDWYDGARLLFSEKFIVGPATPTPPTAATTPSAVPAEKTFAEQYGLWIVAAVVFIAAMVVSSIFLVRRKGTRIGRPSPPAVTARGGAPPAGVKYCSRCGELIPEVALYCPRCASKQEQ